VSPPQDTSEHVASPATREQRSKRPKRARASSAAPAAERPAAVHPGDSTDDGEHSTIVLRMAPTIPSPSEIDEASMDMAPTLGPTDPAGASAWLAQPLPVVQRERYRAAREIGRGGLGRVTAARDQRLGREVAIKELFEPYGDRQARFLREALITAKLQHPSIVPVYDAGYWPSGAPFYAMKLVSGRNLAELIDGASTTSRRLAYLSNAIAAVDAIAYAHSQRVLHRDLKPSNIIVGEYGETVVVDWGLAKPLDAPESDDLAAGPYRDTSSGLTVAGSVLGTPGYMAPEQARGDELDERADIYALGAVLYHLLTGGPPYPDGSVREVLHQVKREEPPPLAERAPDAPAELVTIVAKAMARDPDQRYQRARDLADDLRRFQNGQLVSVHHYSPYDLAQRWLRRHRALVTVASILLVLLAGTAVWSVQRIIHERNVAEARAAEAQAAQARSQRRAEELTVAQAAHQRDATAAVAWLGALPATASSWPAAYLVATGARNRGVARHVWRDHGGDLTDLALSPDGRVLASASRDRTVLVRDLERGSVVRLDDFADWVLDVAFSPAAPHLATADGGHLVQVWSLSGQLVQRFEEHRAPVLQVAFSPDGAHLASASEDGAIVIRALASRSARALTGHAAAVERLAFSPDGAWLASASRDGGVRLWSVAGAGRDQALDGHTAEIRDLAFSGDGAWLATAGADGAVRVWAMPGARLHAVYAHDAEVFAVAFAPGARSLATASSDGAIRRWDLDSGAETRLGMHDEAAVSVAFAPDGARLASAGDDGVVYLWDSATGAELRRYTGARDRVQRLLFAPDGGRLWAMGRISGVREWRLDEPTRQRMRGPRGNVNALAVAPGGAQAVTGHGYGGVMLWDLATGNGTAVDDHASNVAVAQFSADGRYLASGSQSGAVRLHDRRAGTSRILGTHQGWVWWLDFSRDGRWLASAGGDGAIGLWNLATGEARQLAGTASVQHLAFAPDGARLATAAEDGAIALWDLASGTPRVLGHHGGGAAHVAFSPDGVWLASGGKDRQVRLWNLRTGASRALAGHRGGVFELYFSPDGRYLASIAWGDPFVLLWDAHDDNQTRLPLEDPRGLAWAPDSVHLATVGEDATVRLWNAVTRQGHVLDQLEGVADTVAFSDDGTALLAGNRSSELLVWRRDLPADASGLRIWMEQATTAGIDRDGRLATIAP
jgi:WD40 repeat protein